MDGWLAGRRAGAIMRKPRSSSRINLRFWDLEEMDQIELRANQDGLDLQNWIRCLIRDEMKYRRLKQAMLELSVKSNLKSMFILETLVDPTQRRIAEEKADVKFDELKIHAENSDEESSETLSKK